MTDEPTEPDRDLSSTLPRDADLDELRDGGPTETPGARTTTGGRAGPASVAGLRARPNAGPTTTGDATSGGMGTPVGGGTSDATTTGGSGAVAGSDTDREDR
jgi:hypothetical protein